MMIMMTCLMFFLITSVIELPQKKTYYRLFLNLLTRKSFKSLDVTNCWAPILKPLIAFPDFQSLVTIENLYDIKRPTAKKIVKLINSEPVTDQ